MPPSTKSFASWRLNEAHLEDVPKHVAVIKNISRYPTVHASDRTAALIQWESLKCVIRGTLMAEGASMKKERLGNTHG